MRKTKKTLALLLALAMVLTLFAGVAQASALTVRVTSTTAILTPGADRDTGTITVARDSVLGNTYPLVGGRLTSVTITLPADVTWDAADVDPDTVLVGGTWTRERVNAQTAIFRTTNPTDVTPLTITPEVDIASGFRGDVNVTVEVVSSNVDRTIEDWSQTSTVRIARIAAAGTISTAVTTPVVPRGVADQLVGNIRIVEAIAGSLTDGSPEATPTPARVITLTAPSGVTFQSIGLPAVTTVGGVTSTITLAAVTGTQTLNVTGIRLNIGTGVPDGPINIQVSGANATAAFVPVATIGDVGVVSISPRNVPADPISSGSLNSRVADIRFSQNMAGSFLGNRALVLTLPEGFTWNSVVPANWANPINVVPDSRVLTIWTTSTPGAGPDFDLTNIRINVSANAPVGNIDVTVGGTAGPRGMVTVGTLRWPVTIAAVTVPNVKVDSLDQVIGSIAITENFVGALRGGTISVSIVDPLAGMAFVGTPTVTVSDVAGTEPTVSGVTVTTTPTLGVSFTVTRPVITATAPATIIISGIRLNRTVGLLRGVPIAVQVAGTSIFDTGNVRVTAANVVSTTARTTVFTVGSTAFTVNGVAQPPIDVAPFIQDGRTMMPIRAAANAAGVTNDNIFFEAGVITIIRGDRVAQFTLGSRVMVVNGVAMNMDVAPALVSNRALIPVRWVATALGVPVVWDATARTVTVTVQ